MLHFIPHQLKAKSVKSKANQLSAFSYALSTQATGRSV